MKALADLNNYVVSDELMHGLWRWVVPFLAAALILILGSSYFSMARTGVVIEPALRWLLPNTGAQTIGYLHIIIRWSAHSAEYALLSLALVAGPLRGRPVTVLLICIAVASLDEGLQGLRPDRTSSLFEVTLDSGGAVTVLALGLPRWALPREQIRGR